MLYTRRGDKGTTNVFGCNQKISKSSAISEALGTLDEVNSFLGLCKVKSKAAKFKLNDENVEKLINSVQKNLFIIQAEVAGSLMSISEDKVKELESWSDAAEKLLPPIHSFFISGGTELAATFDVARTLARRAERRVVAVSEEGQRTIGTHTLSFLNRLSSFLYAMARLANHQSGIKEQSPDYK